ncbi:PE-PGRS family protein [Streptomyces spiramenti]|uniref:PE-PGRS family protein n=1 Tax=Streptomyces spiramenti TaxID=2720606 RepID=A0ABX1AK41_9ACTN|nr:PE-PGRS family protein [Streptomyces spiramenti]NJP64752.1 PE-PGRS family protein [Streptomyces spiramenti]
MRLTGAVRGVRAAVFAGVCVVLALVGHVHSSGAAVPAPVALAAFAAVAAVAWAAAGARRGPWAVTLAAGGVQLGLHLAFSVGQNAAPPVAAASPGGSVMDVARSLLCGGDTGATLTHERAMQLIMASGLPVPDHDHAAAVAHSATEHGGHAVHAAAALPGTHSGAMLLAHVLAATVSGLWLAWGERAACSLLSQVGPWLLASLRPLLGPLFVPATPPACPRAALDRPLLPLRTRLLLHTVISRGPPLPRAVG